MLDHTRKPIGIPTLEGYIFLCEEDMPRLTIGNRTHMDTIWVDDVLLRELVTQNSFGDYGNLEADTVHVSSVEVHGVRSLSFTSYGRTTRVLITEHVQKQVLQWLQG